MTEESAVNSYYLKYIYDEIQKKEQLIIKIQALNFDYKNTNCKQTINDMPYLAKWNQAK